MLRNEGRIQLKECLTLKLKFKEGLTLTFRQPENEAPLLSRRVLHRLDMKSPREAVAVKGVVNGLVGADSIGQATWGLGARKGKATAPNAVDAAVRH